MTPHFTPSRVLASIVLAATMVSARADCTVHNLFSDHMVLQRDLPAPVWGWADEGETITVEFRGQKVSTRAKGGQWMVRLGHLKAGGPDDLKIAGKNTITLHDVWVGEVWIASGQSNMEFPLRASFQAADDIAHSGSFPTLRLYQVPKLKAQWPTNNVPASWRVSSPESSPGFSAVAYYFGRDLTKALGVPVGIIHTSWGGSPAEVWMSDRVLSGNSNYRRDIVDAYTTQLKKHEAAVEEWVAAKAAAERDGKPFTANRPSLGWRPTELYNGMIAPLVPFAIRGAIWYQGESNAGRAHEYRSLLPDMVRNWRQDWREGDFPFLQVQLAPWDKSRKRDWETIGTDIGDSDWAELREAQEYSTHALPKVGMAVITDLGDKDDIHPTKKELVGARLALQARRIAYGEKIVASGPVFKRVKFHAGRAELSFDSIADGLRTMDVPGIPPQDPKTPMVWSAKTGRTVAPVYGFTIAGADRKFVRATAYLAEDQVFVRSPEVPAPVAVRYGWAAYPIVNLANSEGLPASPFRTDSFPMITEKRK